MQGSDGEFCVVDQHCGIGLECRDQLCKEPLREIGEFCEEDNRCIGGSFCLRNICSVPGAEGDLCAVEKHC